MTLFPKKKLFHYIFHYKKVKRNKKNIHSFNNILSKKKNG